MSLSEFFSTESASPSQMFFRASELPEINPARAFPNRTGARAISLRQVGDSTRHTIQMLHERYAPGADTGPDPIRHEAEEAGVVIAGSIEITVGAQTETLGEGDAYIFDSSLPHRFRNTGDEECVIVSACTPPSF
jgi:mannose-6-phosphate isomerase-like protein (cupin superfamily)